MDLFSNEIDENTNLLPKDGIVNYYGKVINKSFVKIKWVKQCVDAFLKTYQYSNTHHRVICVFEITKDNNWNSTIILH